jgi:hypothetical protein
MEIAARFIALGAFVAFGAWAGELVDKGEYGGALVLALDAVFCGALFVASIFSKEEK